MDMVQTIGLTKTYGSGENIVRALDGINLSVRPGEFVALVGASGSGKSTLLHMLGGLDRPTSGKVLIDGKELSEFSEDQLVIYRRRNIGFVFQNYNLIPILNVYDNITLPINLDGNVVDKKFFGKIVEMLGIEDKLKSLPNQLSGGQQQRVAIARDSKTSQDVLGLLKMTSIQFHQTMIMITHNEQIAQLADRVVRIADGKIVGRNSYAQ